jgi:hypothetical protein
VLQLRHLFVVTLHFVYPRRNVKIFIIFEADATLYSRETKSLESFEYLLLHALFIYLKCVALPFYRTPRKLTHLERRKGFDTSLGKLQNFCTTILVWR